MTMVRRYGWMAAVFFMGMGAGVLVAGADASDGALRDSTIALWPTLAVLFLSALAMVALEPWRSPLGSAERPEPSWAHVEAALLGVLSDSPVEREVGRRECRALAEVVGDFDLRVMIAVVGTARDQHPRDGERGAYGPGVSEADAWAALVQDLAAAQSARGERRKRRRAPHRRTALS